MDIFDLFSRAFPTYFLVQSDAQINKETENRQTQNKQTIFEA